MFLPIFILYCASIMADFNNNSQSSFSKNKKISYCTLIFLLLNCFWENLMFFSIVLVNGVAWLDLIKKT